MANIYRMEVDLASITSALKQALGFVEEFGCKTGLDAKALQKYHYQVRVDFKSMMSFIVLHDSVHMCVYGLKNSAL